jgi:hypothetical protein
MNNNFNQKEHQNIAELEKKLRHISKELKNALNCGKEIDLPLLGESLLKE